MLSKKPEQDGPWKTSGLCFLRKRIQSPSKAIRQCNGPHRNKHGIENSSIKHGNK